MDRPPKRATTTLPPRLRTGDTIAVCAPASPVEKRRLQRGVQVLQQRYRVQVEKGVLAADGYLAGDDDRRSEELNRLFRQPEVRAIIPACGGYGITRILDRLDSDALYQDPKIIIGFSDATALLCWALTTAGVRGVHGPMVASFGERPPAQQQHMLDLLEGKLPAPIRCCSLAQPNSASEQAEGFLLGGNLTLLSALVGTPYQLNLAESLLFMEDVEKIPSTIDRLLTHLWAAGQFRGVKAALLGEIFCGSEQEIESGLNAQDVAIERMATFGIPLMLGVPLGHGKDNLALPFGGRATVDFATGRLILQEKAVA